MISLTCLVIPETADIRLELRLFLNFNGNYLNLVVSKTNLDLKHCRHHELISLNRVKVVLLLLFTTLSPWYMDLILLPL